MTLDTGLNHFLKFLINVKSRFFFVASAKKINNLSLIILQNICEVNKSFVVCIF